MLDVIGVLKECGDCTEIMSKTKQVPIPKRDITIIDSGAREVRVTLWDTQAQQFTGVEGDVAAFKGLRISEWGGLSLSLGGNGTYEVNPDIKESHALRGWYDHVGKTMQTTGFSSSRPSNSTERKFFEETSSIVPGSDEKPLYFANKATITMVKSDNCMYPSHSSNCRKKVTDNGPSSWTCDKCNKEIDEPVWRYILRMSASDSTQQTWLTCFDEEAEKILGMSASQLVEMKNKVSVICSNTR